MGLPEDSGLWELLTRRPLEDMRQLMRHFEEYKRLEDDRLQNKGKAPIINLGLSTGRDYAQPGTDPPESGGGKMHPPPTRLSNRVGRFRL